MDTYNRVNWEDSPSTSTPLNANNLNHMDNGIEAATQAITNLESEVAKKANTTDLNTALANKADKATTLAGYGITNAYTKSEVDTALAEKANQADVEKALAKKADLDAYENTILLEQISSSTKLNDYTDVNKTYAFFTPSNSALASELKLIDSGQLIRCIMNNYKANGSLSQVLRIYDGSTLNTNKVYLRSVGSIGDNSFYDITIPNNYITKTHLSEDLLADFNNKADKATTLAGYGIQDAIKNASGTVKTNHIANGAVGTLQIATGAVTSNELDDGAVTTDEIADGAVTKEKLSDNVIARFDEKADKATINLLSEGLLVFSLFTEFFNGQVSDDGALNRNVKYRVTSENIMKFDYDLNVTVDDGFNAYVVEYSNGVYKSMKSVSNYNYMIPAGTEFRMHIRKVPENTSETANISEFVNAVKFQTKIAIDIAKVNGKQTAQYITDTITTVEDLVALNDVNTVYNGVMSGFSTTFGQDSDTKYVGFKMWFVQVSPKQALSYYRILSLSDGTIWIAYNRNTTIFNQYVYSKSQVDKLLKEKISNEDIDTAIADKADYATVLSVSEGILTFAPYTGFFNGQADNDGTLNRNVKYRVTSEDIMKFDYDLNILLDDGFMGYVVEYDNGAYKSMYSLSNAKYNYVIPAGTEFRMHIRKVPENTSETANISEFVNAVKFLTKTAADISKINKILESIGKDGVQYSENGQIYVENVIVPDTVTALPAGVYSINGIKSVYAPEVTKLGGHYCFGQTPNRMESIICPKLTEWATGSYWCSGGNLYNVQAGSVGYPVESMASEIGFRNNTRKDLIITIYVDAVTIADVPTAITDYAPWGATNATIIYRNSTTGEVITA